MSFNVNDPISKEKAPKQTASALEMLRQRKEFLTI
jgi:hypothetical protein